MKDIKPKMTSVNIDSRIMKNFLEWRILGLTIVLSLGMVIGFMAACVGVAQADIYLLTPSPTDQTVMVTYTIPLSLTSATVYISKDTTLRIRYGPSQQSKIRTQLWRDDQIVIQGTTKDCSWVYITKPQSAFGGWAYSLYLRDLQGNLISDKCPPVRNTDTKSSQPESKTIDSNDAESQTDLFGEQPFQIQDYQMLAIGIIALLLTALLYWIAYTKGFLSRLRQPESSAGISANSKAPKAGMPYLEAMLISAQPIYCPLNGKNISIGRNKENTLVIDSRFAQWDTVSSQHARIEQDGDSFIITDLDSKNGVFVDGRRTQENILYDGMQVSLGKVTFVFRVNGK